MSEYVKRIMPYGSCDILETQQWLEEMSAKGLHFVSSGYFFAKFRKGEPKQTRYRLDFCDVIAGDIPEEKREMYEASGWEVIGDYKSDSVVVCTDDPEAVEIYTDAKVLAKPMRKLGAKHLAYWIVVLIMLGYVYVGPLDEVILGKISMVSYLLEIGTGRFIWTCFLMLAMLAELAAHFVSWRRLKRLRKVLAASGEMPACKPGRIRKAIGKVVTPLSVPVLILSVAQLFVMLVMLNGVSYGTAIDDRTSLPFPMLEEIDQSCTIDTEWSWFAEDTDIIANRILRYDEDFSIESSDEARLCYRLKYYDMRTAKMAEKLYDDLVSGIVEDDELQLARQMTTIYELNDAEITFAVEKASEYETGTNQYMVIRNGTQVEYIYYEGMQDLSDYTKLYVDRLNGEV